MKSSKLPTALGARGSGRTRRRRRRKGNPPKSSHVRGAFRGSKLQSGAPARRWAASTVARQPKPQQPQRPSSCTPREASPPREVVRKYRDPARTPHQRFRRLLTQQRRRLCADCARAGVKDDKLVSCSHARGLSLLDLPTDAIACVAQLLAPASVLALCAANHSLCTALSADPNVWRPAWRSALGCEMTGYPVSGCDMATKDYRMAFLRACQSRGLVRPLARLHIEIPEMVSSPQQRARQALWSVLGRTRATGTSHRYARAGVDAVATAHTGRSRHRPKYKHQHKPNKATRPRPLSHRGDSAARFHRPAGDRPDTAVDGSSRTGELCGVARFMRRRCEGYGKHAGQCTLGAPAAGTSLTRLPADQASDWPIKPPHEVCTPGACPTFAARPSRAAANTRRCGT